MGITQSCINKGTLRRLIALLPAGRLRERCERQLSASSTGEILSVPMTVIQAEADLVVAEYQLKVEPEAASWLIPEIQRLKALIGRLRTRQHSEGQG